MHVAEVIEKIGGFGRYQKLKLLWLSLSNVVNAIHLVASVFLAASVKFRCRVPHVPADEWNIGNQSFYNLSVRSFIPLKDDGTEDSCSIYMKNETSGLATNQTIECSSYVYDRSVFVETIVTQFNLVCDRTALTTVAGIVYMAGLLVGSLIFGALSDRLGRKKTILLAQFMQAAAALIIIFSPNYAYFTAFRFILGASTIGLLISAFILMIELVPIEKRALCAICQTLCWCFGVMLLSGIGYGIREWKYLQVFFTCLSVPFLLSYWWLIDESPVWLVARERYDEAATILRTMAETNKKTYENYILTKDEAAAAEKFTAVFKSKTLVLNVLINSFGWFTVSMGYYGLTLNVGNLVGDLYLNNFISGLVEVPAYLLLFVTNARVGRKWPYISMMMIGGVALIISAFLIVYKSNAGLAWLIVTISMIGKFFVSSAFELLYFWSAEMYPTALRNSIIGENSMCARIGAMISPVIADIPKLVNVSFGVGVAPLVFGIFMVVGGLLSIALPETNGVPLPDSVEEADKMTWNHKLKVGVIYRLKSESQEERETKFN